MISLQELTHGVEWIWLVWLAAVAVVLKMLAGALRRWRRPRWAALLRGEEGVSYSLSHVLVLPIFFLFVCIVFETTWLLVAKIGTMYAAHAGARSAVVWLSAQPAHVRTSRIEQAVWTAMTPFVTGQPASSNWPRDAERQSDEYVSAYTAYFNSGDPNADPKVKGIPETLKQRYRVAASRTKLHRPPRFDGNGPNALVTITVTYRAPLHIPGVARLLDPDGKAPYEYPITSSATLPNEAPENDSRKLGIYYNSDHKLTP